MCWKVGCVIVLLIEIEDLRVLIGAGSTLPLNRLSIVRTNDTRPNLVLLTWVLVLELDQVLHLVFVGFNELVYFLRRPSCLRVHIQQTHHDAPQKGRVELLCIESTKQVLQGFVVECAAGRLIELRAVFKQHYSEQSQSYREALRLVGIRLRRRSLLRKLQKLFRRCVKNNVPIKVISF